MITDIPTKRIYALSQWQTFLRVLPTRSQQKSTGLWQYYVTVTLCILCELSGVTVRAWVRGAWSGAGACRAWATWRAAAAAERVAVTTRTARSSDIRACRSTPPSARRSALESAQLAQVSLSVKQSNQTIDNIDDAVTVIFTIIWYSSTHSFFHSRLKTFLFCKSFPPQPFLFLLRDSLHGFTRTVYCYFWAYLFSTFSFSVFTLFSWSVPCGRLSWLVLAFERTLK